MIWIGGAFILGVLVGAFIVDVGANLLRGKR